MIEMTDEEFYHYWCRFRALHASAGIGVYTPSEEELKERLVRERKIRIVPNKETFLDYPKTTHYNPKYVFDPNEDWEPISSDLNLLEIFICVAAGVFFVFLGLVAVSFLG